MAHRRGTPQNIGWGCSGRPTSQNPHTIYDQNLRYSLPYLLPDRKFRNPIYDLTLKSKLCFRPALKLVPAKISVKLPLI